jgi:uncharacterized protein involved in tolerance to divalent cations
MSNGRLLSKMEAQLITRQLRETKEKIDAAIATLDNEVPQAVEIPRLYDVRTYLQYASDKIAQYLEEIAESEGEP